MHSHYSSFIDFLTSAGIVVFALTGGTCDHQVEISPVSFCLEYSGPENSGTASAAVRDVDKIR